MNFALPSELVLDLVEYARVAVPEPSPDRDTQPLSNAINSARPSLSDLPAQYVIFRMPEDAKQWLNEMSKRLEPHIPDPKERVDLLKTIHHVALRAGLDPQLVLALIDVLSKFQKYAVSNAGTATLGSESREQYITCQKSIERDSGSPVDTSMYEKEEFRIISAVLYSSSDPINAPWPAESAFSIFLNPHARNPILGNLSSRLEAWTEVREDFKRTWMKIPPTRGIQAAR